MKNLSLGILITLISIATYGQIDPMLTSSNWKVEKEKTIYNNLILRLEGKNDIGGLTNVGYETIEQIIAGVEKDASSEMWTVERKNKTIESYRKFSAGGMIHLYLTRLTIDAANTEIFTVIIQDSSGTEIMRKELSSKIPSVPSSNSDYWSNYTTVFLDKEIKGVFYIYVIDRLGRDNSKFKFRVTI
jgi:hypothetical protein